MLTNQVLPTAHPPEVRTPRPSAGLWVAVVAHSPFLAAHADWLWARPHYQFFPLVLLGAGVLAYARLRGLAIWRPGAAAVAAAGLVAAWLLLAAAEAIGSPWLGCLSLMALLPSLLYATGGGAAV